MNEWGFKDAATAESFLKSRNHRQSPMKAERKRQLLKVERLSKHCSKDHVRNEVACDENDDVSVYLQMVLLQALQAFSSAS